MKSLYLIVIALFISSCSNFVYEELAHIHKGMSNVEVKNIINNDDFGPGIELYNDDISEDLYTSGDVTYLVAEKYSPIESEPYVFVFIDNRLVYWGFPYQVANNENPKIRKSSLSITKKVLEEYY